MPISFVFQAKFTEKYFKKSNHPKLISSSSMDAVWTSYLNTMFHDSHPICSNQREFLQAWSLQHSSALKESVM